MLTLKLAPRGPVVAKLEVADGLWTRTKGLLGRDGLPTAHGLWITPCNSVHTFFMRFALDLVFLDRDLVVRRIYQHVRPNRLVLPVLAHSVIEFESGFVKRTPFNIGERVYVDHPLS